jgi:(3R)-3-hydroxyacyl-CoA dehydrogenase / 3a,7a,12a-trihydroxy-5b-cholest-24-enoyl-CoA hydratase / enoyl-CoA hydratase 2
MSEKGKNASITAKTGNEFVDLEQALGFQFQPTQFSYSERDVSLYALSIGAAADAIDQKELQFVYELSGGSFLALPTFAVIFPFGALEQIVTVPGLKFNLMNLLHGEQYLEVKRPIATKGTITNKAHISQIYDKGSGALVILDIHSADETGAEIAFNRASIFLRGVGNFGGDRGPSGKINLPPDREPDAIFRDNTTSNQALLYRLASGDKNPLHADPRFAALVGFERPILHGLCTFGFAGRAVLKQFAGNNPALFKSIEARFSRHVYPGESIITEMWRESEGRILFQSKVGTRNEVVLANGAVKLHETFETG